MQLQQYIEMTKWRNNCQTHDHHVHHALHSNEYAECQLPGRAIEILLMLQVNESQMAKMFGVSASFSSIIVTVSFTLRMTDKDLIHTEHFSNEQLADYLLISETTCGWSHLA